MCCLEHAHKAAKHFRASQNGTFEKFSNRNLQLPVFLCDDPDRGCGAGRLDQDLYSYVSPKSPGRKK